MSDEVIPLEAQPPSDLELVDCSNCGRHFATERIDTHEIICKSQKKRKPFDMGLQRVRGTDAEKYYKKIKKENAKPKQPSTGQPSWRKQHEEFIESMRAARAMNAILKKGGNVKDLPPPPKSDYSDYIQCPTCLRKFCQTAAERHIPKCAELELNKPKVAPQKKEKILQKRKDSAKPKN